MIDQVSNVVNDAITANEVLQFVDFLGIGVLTGEPFFEKRSRQLHRFGETISF
ncbi:hypothetical protein D3C80_1972010 [compost metagenome]